MDLKKNYKILLKSISASIFISLILLLILSVVLALTSVKESIINIAIIFISAISILIGAFFASSKIKEKGIINGIFVGAIYMIVLYLLSSLSNWDFSITTNVIIMFGFGILGGAIGGILGVNLK